MTKSHFGREKIRKEKVKDMDNMNGMNENDSQNRDGFDERFIVSYDTQTGEAIYNDGTRGQRREVGSQYRFGPETMKYQQDSNFNNTQGQANNDPYRTRETVNENVYQFQDNENIRPKKKKEKKGWTMPKIALGAAMFGVIAAGCFFGVNAGLKALTGGESETVQSTEQVEPAKVEATTDDTKVVNVSNSDVSGVVEQVMPAVVGISEKGTAQNIFGQEYEAEGAGSGFIVKQDGDELLVVTNSHVVADAQEINVIFCDDEEVPATVKGTSNAYDIALLMVDMSKIKESTKKAIKTATLRGSDDVKVGEMAIAIGNANGRGQSVTVGYVSALDRTFVIGTTNSKGEANTCPMIQTDASINPGNSGGPLIDIKGRVIGITTSKVFSASDGRDIVGMNYAIQMSDVVSVINDLMNREVLKDEEKGYLGITGETVDQEAAKMYNIPEGVYVKSLSDTGAAYKAGIQQGDVITSIDGTEVTQISDVKEIVNSKRVGTTIEVTVQRNNGRSYEEQKIKVKLESKDTLDGLPEDESEKQEEEQPEEQIPDQGDDYQIIPWGFGY